VPTPEKTIAHGTLRRLIDAGANVIAEVTGDIEGWGVAISYERVTQRLAATRGQPRIFRQFETLAGYLKELGIVEYRVNAAAFEPAAASRSADDKRSLAASARMKHAHQAAEYDTWFKAQLQASVDDPRPGVPDEEAKARMASRRDALLGKAVKKARR
jgi:hypothetical protein